MKKLLLFLAVMVTFMSLSSFCDNNGCKMKCIKKTQLNNSQNKTGDALFNLSPLSHISAF
jgi:hypothetical protein